MLFLRIKQAETALDDGRLDEAFDLAKAADVRGHRQGQRLVSRMVTALVARGQEHLAGGRYPQAMADGNRAEQLGGNVPPVVELKAAVARAAEHDREVHRQRADVLDQARAYLDKGELSLAERVLDQLTDPTSQAEVLQQHAERRRMEMETVLKHVRSAVERGEWRVAVEELLKAKSIQPGHSELGELAAQVRATLCRELRAAVEQGRLDRTEDLVPLATRLAGQDPDVQEWTRIVGQLREASELIAAGGFAPAGRILRQLSSILSSAPWIAEAIAACTRGAEAMETLAGGALGLGMVRGVRGYGERPERDGGNGNANVLSADLRPPISDRAFPSRFILRVEGVGAFLVVRDSPVRVGPVSSSLPPDIGLIAAPNLAGVTLERAEGDYLLKREDGSKRLLTHGETIEFGPRCRIKFLLPHPASTSAILRLEGARLPQGDVRQVILLDREIVIGGGASSHVRIDGMTEPVVLYMNDGRLVWRGRESSDGVQKQIPLNEHVRVGAVSLIVVST